jgi:hypothetical protein
MLLKVMSFEMTIEFISIKYSQEIFIIDNLVFKEKMKR